ncbi:HNH endonuclease [Escherichia coli]|nr:HNH endonuclease [Escherichia coli]
MCKPHEEPHLLRELFTYDANTGRIHHAKDKGSRAKAGAYADTATDSKGYRMVRVAVDGQYLRAKAHRVAWILARGSIPDGLCIDHVNGVRDDNRLCNLRLVTNQENLHNLRAVKGYHWDSRNGKWRARIEVGGRSHSLGYHATKDAARAAYLAAKRVYHPSAPINFQGGVV